jgi:hypothetical protein
MKRSICFKFILLFLFSSVLRISAGSYFTVASGNWNSTIVWLNGQVPPLAGTDSIFIATDVMYTNSLNLVSSTYLRIDTSGSLCGHERFRIQQGSKVDNYGDLNADSLFINGGLVTNYGLILLTNMAVLTNGGSFVNSGMMQIGATFLCPEKTAATGIIENESENNSINFFPQPAKQNEEIHFNFNGGGENYLIRIFSVTGQFIAEIPITENHTFYLTGISPGIYFAFVMDNEKKINYGKLIVSE